MNSRAFVYWGIQGPGWALLLYLLVAQAIPAFDYEIGVRMGTQESAVAITEVGAAFWYGFAFADLVAYIPLLAIGLTLYWLNHRWASPVLAAALGITVYWPVVCLAAVVSARGADGWNLPNETGFWIVLPLVFLWGAFALWRLTVEHRKGET
jgi:hypothetical protein